MSRFAGYSQLGESLKYLYMSETELNTDMQIFLVSYAFG